jgi:hypothetical protein
VYEKWNQEYLANLIETHYVLVVSGPVGVVVLFLLIHIVQVRRQSRIWAMLREPFERAGYQSVEWQELFESFGYLQLNDVVLFKDISVYTTNDGIVIRRPYAQRSFPAFRIPWTAVSIISFLALRSFPEIGKDNHGLARVILNSSKATEFVLPWRGKFTAHIPDSVGFEERSPQSPDAWPLATPERFIEACKSVIVGDEKSWVLFRNGTFVLLRKPETDLANQAIDLMRQFGPVHAGSPAGDFTTTSLTDDPGWVVASHHNDILTYVSPDEVPGGKATDIEIGLYGRNKRDLDAAGLEVIHIEDRRGLN